MTAPLQPPEHSPNRKLMNFLFSGWNRAFYDLMRLVDIIQAQRKNRVPLVLKIGLSLTITWFIYVPVHELFHCAGCVCSGGSVSELILGREYGAAALQRLFPFIEPRTTRYAGRLTGFEPAGDISYFICVLSPFILSVFPGVFLFVYSLSRKAFWSLGPGLIIGLASFTNLTGDFFEMGTIVSTQLVNRFGFGYPAGHVPNFWMLRSDDILRLFREMAASPAEYGLNSFSGTCATGSAVVIGLFLAVVFSGWIYQAGRWIAGRFRVTGEG
ncbi:hypothetical protein JXA40_06780 [bacterium]|nr:hypothetical protein [candidate division CSSED10-310 bacterium]